MGMLESACILTCWLLPSVAVVIFCSDMGYGIATYAWLLNASVYGHIIAAAGLALWILLLAFGSRSCMRRFLGIIATYAVLVGMVMKAKDRPHAPIAIAILHGPLLTAIMRRIFFKNARAEDFYSIAAFCSFLSSAGITELWCLWVWHGDFTGVHTWTAENQRDLLDRSVEIYQAWGVNHILDCASADATQAVSRIIADAELERAMSCASAQVTVQLLWVAPFVCGICFFVSSVFCALRYRHIARLGHAQNEAVPNVFAASWCAYVLLSTLIGLLSLLWPAVALAGAWPHLGATLVRLALGALAVVLGVIHIPELHHFTPRSIRALRNAGRLRRSLLDESRSTREFLLAPMGSWAQAFLLLCAGPFLLLLGCFSLCRPIDRSTPPSRAADLWSQRVVLCRATALAAFYMMLIVGSGRALPFIITRYMVEINDVIVACTFGAAAILISCPFVSSPLVFIALGAVICNPENAAHWTSTEQQNALWVRVAIAVVIGVSVKALALIGQFLIGACIRGHSDIQGWLYSCDSLHCLRDGLLAGCGCTLSVLASWGPDWPCGVLCGVLGIPLWRCLAGLVLSPFLALPCALAGALLWRKDASMEFGFGVVPLLVAATAVSSTSVAALLAVRSAAAQLEEKENIPLDEDSDDDSQTPAALSVPRSQRASKALVLTVIVAAGAVFLVTAFDEQCFRPAGLGGSIGAAPDDVGFDEAFFCLFRTWGWVALAATATSVVASLVMTRGTRFLASSNRDYVDDDEQLSGVCPRDSDNH